MPTKPVQASDPVVNNSIQRPSTSPSVGNNENKVIKVRLGDSPDTNAHLNLTLRPSTTAQEICTLCEQKMSYPIGSLDLFAGHKGVG